VCKKKGAYHSKKMNLPTARRLSDNSTGGSAKIVFKEYGRRKH
jgi:hypothetical protein